MAAPVKLITYHDKRYVEFDSCVSPLRASGWISVDVLEMGRQLMLYDRNELVDCLVKWRAAVDSTAGDRLTDIETLYMYRRSLDAACCIGRDDPDFMRELPDVIHLDIQRAMFVTRRAD